MPGIISLLIIPFIFYRYSEVYLKSISRNVIEVNWFSPELIKMYPKIFTDSYPPKREYATVRITGDKSDKIKLNSAQLKIREIISNEDSQVGIHFIFENQSKYAEFIKTLDILQIEGSRNYMPYKNNIWFYVIGRRSENNSKESLVDKNDCFLCGDYRISITEKSNWEVLSQYAADIWKDGWQILVAFIAFLASIVILKIFWKAPSKS